MKIAILLFLLVWSFAGVVMLFKYEALFGPHADDPAESAGSRSLSFAHIASVWFGFFALAIYFLLR